MNKNKNIDKATDCLFKIACALKAKSLHKRGEKTEDIKRLITNEVDNNVSDLLLDPILFEKGALGKSLLPMFFGEISIDDHIEFNRITRQINSISDNSFENAVLHSAKERKSKLSVTPVEVIL